MIKKILVALDVSESASKAMNCALEIARRFDAQICAVSVVQLPDYSATIGEVEEVKDEGVKHFEKVHNQFKFLAEKYGVNYTQEIIFGHPAETIINYAAKNSVDLIVIGHIGRSAVTEFLIGSVSQKVSVYAKCSVMIVK